MIDRFGRKIDYLRISLTDKCNLRCVYCMPEEGIPKRRHEEFLSFEEITEVVRVAVELGIRKVRLTGGEPLVKRDIVTLVGMIKSIGGLEHLAVTTNGALLANHLPGLAEARLDSVNISLDTLDAERYKRITRGGDIRRVLRGIDAAKRAGLSVKLNMVMLEDTSPAEVEGMRRYCRKKDLRMQIINHFDLKAAKREFYRFDRPPDCSQCNRLRLLADGSLKPCLHSDREVKIDLRDIRSSLMKAIEDKPKEGTVCLSRGMIEIGG